MEKSDHVNLEEWDDFEDESESFTLSSYDSTVSSLTLSTSSLISNEIKSQPLLPSLVPSSSTVKCTDFPVFQSPDHLDVMNRNSLASSSYLNSLQMNCTNFRPFYSDINNIFIKSLNTQEAFNRSKICFCFTNYSYSTSFYYFNGITQNPSNNYLSSYYAKEKPVYINNQENHLYSQSNQSIIKQTQNEINQTNNKRSVYNSSFHRNPYSHFSQRYKRCYHCGSLTHIAKFCPLFRSLVKSQNTPLNKISEACFLCGKVGHIAKDCSKNDSKLCFYCMEKGHLMKNCPFWLEKRKRREKYNSMIYG